MLSIIAEKGHKSDDIFTLLPKESHRSLKHRLDSEQHIDWNEESVLVIASVLKDFIINIRGSLLTSEFYENWLSIPDEGTLAGQINSIQRLLQKIPEPNFILLKHLICVLVIIKDSPMNKLDTEKLSILLGPYLLWGCTSNDAFFGKSTSRKLSIIQIMIDNYHLIFGNDDLFIKHTDKESDDLRMNEESKNSSDKSHVMTNVIACHNGTTCENNEKFSISYAALQEAGPTGQNTETATYKW